MSAASTPRFLLRHVGNMGDLVFFIPPIVAGIKAIYPAAHITLVAPWGFKESHLSVEWKKGELPHLRRNATWGNRNQDGFSLHLMATNPHIDQLVHWHDTITDYTGSICKEDNRHIPTWSKQEYEQQKKSGRYDHVYELDIGITHTENPLKKLFAHIELPQAYRSDYKLYFTPQDMAIAQTVMAKYPHPRIVLLEGLDGLSTRGWDPAKTGELTKTIHTTYDVKAIRFGSRSIPYWQGRPLTLRENIATLTQCDIGIGVLSGPLHFAVAAGLPTITLYADQPLRRTAPAYFLNSFIRDDKKKHRTILGATGHTYQFLKNDTPSQNLTEAEIARQKGKNWLVPGKQSTKSPLAVITVEEVMAVLADVINVGH